MSFIFFGRRVGIKLAGGQLQVTQGVAALMGNAFCGRCTGAFLGVTGPSLVRFLLTVILSFVLEAEGSSAVSCALL